MLRKLNRVLTPTIVFIVLTLSLNSWLNWKNLPIPIVRNAEDAKFADGLTLQAAGPNSKCVNFEFTQFIGFIHGILSLKLLYL